MKAVLVKEMPENCLNCDGWRNAMGGYGCVYGDLVFADLYIRQSECPLRPLPEKREMINAVTTTLDFWSEGWMAKGWNDCLDAITGEEKT